MLSSQKIVFNSCALTSIKLNRLTENIMDGKINNYWVHSKQGGHVIRLKKSVLDFVQGQE